VTRSPVEPAPAGPPETRLPRKLPVKERHSTVVRREAVRLVAAERHQVRKVAAAAGISCKVLRRWVREAEETIEQRAARNDL